MPGDKREEESESGVMEEGGGDREKGRKKRKGKAVFGVI